MGLRLTVEPTIEPMDLATVKSRLRVDDTARDLEITMIIAAARKMAEQQTTRSLMLQTWELTLDNFPAAIKLTHPPIASISSVKYIDILGSEQTLSPSSYKLDASSDYVDAWLVPAYGYAWPAVHGDINVVKIIYVAGYANAATVPEAIKMWMLFHMGTMLDNLNSEEIVRGNSIQLALVDRLIDRYVVQAL